MAYIEGSQARIHYEQAGEGPDIVWVSGGGGTAADWDEYQIPHFEGKFRNTTFDNRGIGTTTCDLPLPWTLEDFARDTADLIEAVCEPPVALVGLSLGGGIVQQVALDYPELLRVVIPMGTGARTEGWAADYMRAEIEWRKAGNRLDGMMAVAHYAAMLYPARVLGDPDLWPRLRAEMLAWIETDVNEDSLIPQWEACFYDQSDRLPGCTVPMHVMVFNDDVQAPPQGGEEVAELVPGAELHLFEGMGHCSIYGHTHEVLNAEIEAIITRYF